jgi:hypothetical protein
MKPRKQLAITLAKNCNRVTSPCGCILGTAGPGPGVDVVGVVVSAIICSAECLAC